MGYRHPNHSRSVETVAWVTNWTTADGWRRDSPVYRHYYDGACRCAEEMGYHLQHFWMREKNMTRARFEQVLRARRIRGLILAPQPAPHSSIELTWSQYAAVKIGYSLEVPALHTVTCSHFDSMKKVLEALKNKGYRRIGYCCQSSIDERVGHAWLAAYMLISKSSDLGEPIPPQSMSNPRKSSFVTWLREHRPDAVITTGPRLAGDIRNWCEQSGLRVPQDIGLALVSNVDPNGELSGIHEHSEEIGAISVKLLASMLNANETGIPDFPQRILIDGTWAEGRTVRKKPGRPSKARVARAV